MVRLLTFLRSVDWDLYRDLAAELLEAGDDEAEVVEVLAKMLDAAFNFEALVPGPAGPVLEGIDGYVFEGVLRPLVKAFRDVAIRRVWLQKRHAVISARRGKASKPGA